MYKTQDIYKAYIHIYKYRRVNMLKGWIALTVKDSYLRQNVTKVYSYNW